MQLPADLLAGDGQGVAGPVTDTVADLLAEVTDLRERLARAETEREAARAVATAEVAAADATAAAVVAAAREQLDRELARVARLEEELRELRRPWWRRFISS